MTKWQPIETAPKDRIILGYIPDFWVEGADGFWPGSRSGLAFLEWFGDEDGWHTHDCDTLGHPTHWMNPPEPPEE